MAQDDFVNTLFGRTIANLFTIDEINSNIKKLNNTIDYLVRLTQKNSLEYFTDEGPSIFDDLKEEEVKRRTAEILAEIAERCVRTESGCMLWQGRKTHDGYGLITINGKEYRVHKLIMEIMQRTNIPPKMVVMHHCDNRHCCEITHLKIETQAENMADMARKGRSTKGSRNPASKLTEEIIPSIFHDSRPLEEIARDYNVDRKTIKAVKDGKSWRHVTDKLIEESGLSKFTK